ncbi:MAG TPA: fatty acid--CoA ligase family protein [Steroidobacteraceae bacterium]|nr:fatty acid--CoA ligase family protein [Steroidobacteraceae bacterium]
MHVDFLIERFRQASESPAIVWRDAVTSYGWLADELGRLSATLQEHGVPRGAVVSVEADFSPRAVALLLALIERGAIIVPLTSSVEEKKPEFREIAEVESLVSIDAEDRLRIETSGRTSGHELLLKLKALGHPGLILFSSGSTGKSKAALHDIVPMLEKFKVPRHTLRTITFLLFDHIGGFNTLLYNLSNAGCVVTVPDRRPETICRAVEQHGVELLPTSPTFLNLLLVSEAFRRYDLSSLKMVTYGTEVMPESTLKRFHAAFPQVKLLQTYGLSEVGILRSKSKSSDSLWVKVGGEGFETRVIDGMLEIKAKSAMLGYLNHPSPFTADGWFKTGDAVEVDGEYLRILGRKSELINVGGEKVYPAEVESVLQLMEGVEDVAVTGQPHPMTGQIVFARVKLSSDESLAEFRVRMRQFCQDKLPRYAVPQKVELVEESLHGERFKKMRRV